MADKSKLDPSTQEAQWAQNERKRFEIHFLAKYTKTAKVRMPERAGRNPFTAGRAGRICDWLHIPIWICSPMVDFLAGQALSCPVSNRIAGAKAGNTEVAPPVPGLQGAFRACVRERRGAHSRPNEEAFNP